MVDACLESEISNTSRQIGGNIGMMKFDGTKLTKKCGSLEIANYRMIFSEPCLNDSVQLKSL